MTINDFKMLLRWAVSKGRFGLADKFYRQACYLHGDQAAGKVMAQLILELEA
jgi:hypothetical protein